LRRNMSLSPIMAFTTRFRKEPRPPPLPRSPPYHPPPEVGGEGGWRFERYFGYSSVAGLVLHAVALPRGTLGYRPASVSTGCLSAWGSGVGRSAPDIHPWTRSRRKMHRITTTAPPSPPIVPNSSKPCLCLRVRHDHVKSAAIFVETSSGEGRWVRTSAVQPAPVKTFLLSPGPQGGCDAGSETVLHGHLIKRLRVWPQPGLQLTEPTHAQPSRR
jgi:hypothetical protein